MQKVLAVPTIALMVVIALATALTVFAYEDLEIEIETSKSSTKVTVTYEVDDDEVEAYYTYNTTDRNEVYQKIAQKLDLTVDEVKDAIDDEDDDDSEDAREEIDDAKSAIAKAEAFIDRLDDDTDTRGTYESWLTTAKDLLADANDAYDEGKFSDAERLAEQAEDKAKYIYESKNDDKDDKDDDRGHGNDKDRCDEDNPGKSKSCKDSSREKLGDRYKNFGTTTDRDELQAQLRELMLLLIQLLQQARINF